MFCRPSLSRHQQATSALLKKAVTEAVNEKPEENTEVCAKRKYPQEEFFIFLDLTSKYYLIYTNSHISIFRY